MVAVAVSSITAGFPHVGPQGRALDHSPVPRGGLVLGTDSLSELIVVLGDEGGYLVTLAINTVKEANCMQSVSNIDCG